MHKGIEKKLSTLFLCPVINYKHSDYAFTCGTVPVVNASVLYFKDAKSALSERL